MNRILQKGISGTLGVTLALASVPAIETEAGDLNCPTGQESAFYILPGSKVRVLSFPAADYGGYLLASNTPSIAINNDRRVCAVYEGYVIPLTPEMYALLVSSGQVDVTETSDGSTTLRVGVLGAFAIPDYTN